MWISAWRVFRWPVAVILVIIGNDLIYYFARRMPTCACSSSRLLARVVRLRIS